MVTRRWRRTASAYSVGKGGTRTCGGAANQRPQNAGAVIRCKRSTVGALTDPKGG